MSLHEDRPHHIAGASQDKVEALGRHLRGRAVQSTNMTRRFAGVPKGRVSYIPEPGTVVVWDVSGEVYTVKVPRQGPGRKG